MSETEITDLISKSYSPLTPACQQALLSYLQISFLEKGTVLVREGQHADQAYYLVQGCARAYYLQDGRDISDWFAFENEFISSIVSFFAHRPSPHYIELLENSIVVQISRTHVEKLSDKYHDFERLIRTVVTQTMLRQQERISSILFYSAAQRYENLLAVHPNITQRVPLMHLASYLGITLETLSRIRRPKGRI